MSLAPNWQRRLASPSALEDPAVPRAGVAIVVHTAKSGDAAVLLMRRAEHPQDPWSGHVSLPGGRVDPTDASSEAAARRETFEELGVDLHQDAHLIGALKPMPATARGAVLDLLVHPWVYQLEREVELVLNAEAQAGFWLPLRAALAGELDHEHSITRDGLVHRRPAWRVGEHVVWGLTYQILLRFLERVSSPRAS